jgi:tol-pal system protein YbgF
LRAELEVVRKEVRELRGQVEEAKALAGNQRGQMEETRTLATRQDEQQRALIEDQRKTREIQRAMEERLNGLPMLVSEDGASFYAQATEKEFDNAKAVFKRANYLGARKQFDEFLLRYPHGGYAAGGRFWKGNAEFLQGDYKAALLTLRPLQVAEPNYQKTPEAMLAIANRYSELKDPQSARKTLEDLVEQYERHRSRQRGPRSPLQAAVAPGPVSSDKPTLNWILSLRIRPAASAASIAYTAWMAAIDCARPTSV